MSYKSYNLGVLSYNYFQIYVLPAYRQVQEKNFAAMRQTHFVNYNILNFGLSLDGFGCQNFRCYANKLIRWTKYVFLSVELVNNVNECNKNSVYDVL